MQTLALVTSGLMLALVAAAFVGRWWLRRLALQPVRPAAAGIPGSCEQCPQISLMAAQGGGGRGSRGGGSSSGPNRRAFLRGALGLSAFGALGGFGAASLAFLWPDLRGGFGAVIEVGNEEDVLSEIDGNNGRMEFPTGRALLVRYDPGQDADDQYADITNDQQARVLALYQVCVHLGCTVPFCETSQWWECPCHGSQYNRWGEWQDGPAPRGLDRFRVSVDDSGTLLLDTSEIITGPSRGSGSLEQPAEGPHCV